MISGGIRRAEEDVRHARRQRTAQISTGGEESSRALLIGEAPDTSTVGLVLLVLSLIVMPALACAKQTTGREMENKALQADAGETWVCAYALAWG